MESWKKMILIAFAITVLIIAGTTIYFQYFAKRRVMISTTTSLHHTGLLDAIEKVFEKKYPIDLNFIPVGTGIAIQHAKNGDVDIILVHSPTLEKFFLEEGFGVCRKIIAYNFFAIVGPETDPAGTNGTSPTEALKRIAEYGKNEKVRTWISRGDNSGTHWKERSLWQMAGYNWTELSKESWHVDAGSDMGSTLMKAEYFSAYTLTDMGTYLTYYTQRLVKLKPLVTQRQELLNVYSVIAVNKARHPHVNFEGAINFTKFLISAEGQQLIENYGKDEYGQSLFHGAVELLNEDPTSQIAQWIRDYAFFNGSECPPEYGDNHPELYGERNLN